MLQCLGACEAGFVPKLDGIAGGVLFAGLRENRSCNQPSYLVEKNSCEVISIQQIQGLAAAESKQNMHNMKVPPLARPSLHIHRFSKPLRLISPKASSVELYVALEQGVAVESI